MYNGINRRKEDEGIDLIRIFFTLVKYRLFIVILTASGALVIFLYVLITSILPPESSMMPDIYRSHAIVSINQRIYSDILQAFFSPAQKTSLGSGFNLLTQSFSYGEYLIKILKGKTILDLVGKEFDMAKRYKVRADRTASMRDAIRRHLSLEFDESTLTVTVSYDDYDPDYAQKVVDKFVALLGDRILNLKEAMSIEQSALLDKKLEEVRLQVSLIEQKLKRLQTRYGVIDIESLISEKTTILANLRSELIKNEVEIRTYSNFSSIEDPTLQKLKAEQENLRRMIAEMEAGYIKETGRDSGSSDIPDIVIEYSHLKGDLEIHKRIYDILLQENALAKIRVSIEGEEPIFQVLEGADLPDTKIGPNRAMLCIIGAGMIFGLSCLLVLLYNYLKKIGLFPIDFKKWDKQ
ncbi:MAG: hypothetical protein JW904_02660 [Spirochaetales bacterium]|nr:hypothetical protein [Spirochaetales bacterium]